MNNKPLQGNPNKGNRSNTTTEKPTFTRIGNQTDIPSNIRRGTEPSNPIRVKNPIDDPQLDIPIPLTNLHKFLNGNFKSEAIGLDNQSNRMKKMIQNKDRLALKHYSR